MPAVLVDKVFGREAARSYVQFSSMIAGSLLGGPTGAAIGSALGAGVNAAFFPLQAPNISGHATPVKLDFNQDGSESRHWGYGRCGSGGTLKYWETTGVDNKELWRVVAFHDTQIDAIEAYYGNDVLVPFTGSGATGTYANQLFRYDKLGAIDQAAETNLNAASAVWTANHKLGGIAYFVDKQIFKSTIFPTGALDPFIIFRARRLWDPRTAGATITTSVTDTFTTSAAHGLVAGDPVFIKDHTATFTDQTGRVRTVEGDFTVFSAPTATSLKLMKYDGTALTLTANGAGGTATEMAWTANAALCLLDYLMGVRLNGLFIGGCKCPLSLIDLDSFSAGATICDQDVDLDGGGTEDRYTVHGMVGSLEDKRSVVEAMLQAMAGFLTTKNGKLTLHVGAAETAIVTLTDDDLAGGLSVNPSRSIQDKHNIITSVRYDRLAKEGIADVPELRVSAYITEDGGLELEREIRHRFTDSNATAQRINKIFLYNEREQLTIEGGVQASRGADPAFRDFLLDERNGGLHGAEDVPPQPAAHAGRVDPHHCAARDRRKIRL